MMSFHRSAGSMAALALCGLLHPAFAYDDLPKTAQPMAAASLTKAYSGKSLTSKDAAV
jgi:hypothetical protein